uniref:Uncharacterized protein n=2 Tax=Oryza TaxID=4527 RepID=A0A0E0NT28_ORYRU
MTTQLNCTEPNRHDMNASIGCYSSLLSACSIARCESGQIYRNGISWLLYSMCEKWCLFVMRYSIRQHGKLVVHSTSQQQPQQ